MLLNPNPWWSHLPTNQLNEEEEGFFMVVQKDSFQHSVCGVLEVGPVGPSWGGAGCPDWTVPGEIDPDSRHEIWEL